MIAYLFNKFKLASNQIEDNTLNQKINPLIKEK